MFPERQHGPHKEWKDEVRFLDEIFHSAAAYTIGKVNGDHWLLYITSPSDVPDSPEIPRSILTDNKDDPAIDEQSHNISDTADAKGPLCDYTIEILMSQLSPEAGAPFFSTETDLDTPSEVCSKRGLELSTNLGISELFPPHLTTLDPYSFTPCGFSANALLKWGDAAHEDNFTYGTQQGRGGEGYYTIHVTPEAGWSYASFECNVPLRSRPSAQPDDIPDLKTLIRRVAKIFQPGRMTLTLFISCEDNNVEDEQGETPVDAAQRAFKAALTVPRLSGRNDDNQGSRKVYKRTDKINYEFGGYDLAFASFELR